jgi:hypothetical protein
MPRASWKGFLRLSLVSCPIYLSPAATRTKSIRLHQVWQPKDRRGAPIEDDEEDEQPGRQRVLSTRISTIRGCNRPRRQQQIVAPQLGRVLFDEVGAQQIPAFARSYLLLQFLMTRHPGGDRTDDRLSTGVDMNVLDCDALLTLAAATIERLGQSGKGPREFTRLVQALAPTVEVLPVNRGTAVAFHRRVMDCGQLRAEHSLECVCRLHCGHRGELRAYLLIRSGVIRALGQDCLMNEISGEILVVGASERACNVGPLCEPRVFDQVAGLLAPCRRRSFLLSFASPLRARSRI